MGLYFICSGRVKVLKEDSEGRNQIMRIVQAPDILGDRSFFSEQSYMCSGQAMEESRICFLETQHFWEICRVDAVLLRLLVKRFARELGHAEECMHCLATRSVYARMATYLWKASRQPKCVPSPGRDGFDIAETRTELAQTLGTTLEMISRTLADLNLKKLISVRGQHVRILDADGLKRLVYLPD